VEAQLEYQSQSVYPSRATTGYEQARQAGGHMVSQVAEAGRPPDLASILLSSSHCGAKENPLPPWDDAFDVADWDKFEPRAEKACSHGKSLGFLIR
jgi:hypothetical protein